MRAAASNYLEIIGGMREHPDAPAALKDNWQTVKDWLRFNDRSEVKTRQHERFARGLSNTSARA